MAPASKWFGSFLALLGALTFTGFQGWGQEKSPVDLPAPLLAAKQRAASPSPLDKLKAEAIPPLERFAWQPKELVAVLGEHRGRQGAPATAVAFTIDGKLVASGGTNGLIRFWDKTTMRQHLVLGAHSGAVRRIVFFADGKAMASCGDDATVRIWDLTGKEPKAGPIMHDGSTPLYGLAVSPNGKLVAAGGSDSCLRMWELGGKEPQKRAAIFKHQGPIHCLVFSPTGKSLVSAGGDETIRLWPVADNQLKEGLVLTGHKKDVMAVAFSPDGNTLASGGSDGTLRLWSLTGAKPRERAILQGKNGSIYGIAFGPKGSNTLATANTDYTARVWTYGGTPRERAVVEGHENVVNALAFFPSKSGRATTLATASSDWTVRLWDLTTAKPHQRTVVKGHLSHVYGVAFSPDGKTLASGSDDKTLRLWDMATGGTKEQYILRKDGFAIYTLAYHPDGKSLAYGGNDVGVRLWDSQRRWQVRRFTGHPGAVSELAFDPSGRFLLTCSHQAVKLFDVATGSEERSFKGHTKAVGSVAFSPDGRRALSGGGAYEMKDGIIVVKNGKAVFADCTARLWDVSSGKELCVFKDQEFPVLHVAFAPDGRHIALGLQDQVLRFYELAGDKPGKAAKVPFSAGYGYWVTYAPDGNTFATMGPDGKLILWDAASNKRLREWTLNENTYRVTYSPDSRHLAVPLGTGVVYILRIQNKGP
jgi:WD40 repeat protein